MSEEEDIAILNGLGNAFGEGIAEALHTSVAATAEMRPDISDTVTIAAAINGGVLGVMQFMSDMVDQGRLIEPDHKLELMFRMAADVWAQIRGAKGGEVGTVQ